MIPHWNNPSDAVEKNGNVYLRLPVGKILVTLLFFLLLTGCVGPYVYTTKSGNALPEINSDAAVMADGYTLPLLAVEVQDNPPRAVVLALHGFNDYNNAFLLLGQYLAERDITLIAYDQRGFGRTVGRKYWHGASKMTGDLLTMVRLLSQKYQGVPLFILGESMGGAVVLASLEELQSEGGYTGVILVAPAVWAWQTMPWYQRSAMWLFAHLLPWFEVSGKGLDITPSDNVKMLRELGRDPLVIKGSRVDTIYGLSNLMGKALSSVASLSGEALILYGRHDEIIPRHPTCEMLKRLPQSESDSWRFILYDDGYHMLTRDLQAEVVYSDIERWIGEVLELPDSQQTVRQRGARKEDVVFICD